ncbi:unnamed protein product [Mytilus coruscus]|uniref:Uncharacterized protein n=1 Tax=Mytilus coruscus TaxID=42192 RepID=A0A6J8EU66_MYTCO|nr:unnamed protein product [Mytilus coruscus]
MNRNKLRLYRRYKKDLQPEQYASDAMPCHLRGYLCKLRCGTLPLSVETGRYRKPPLPLDERIYPFCHYAIKDEIHFLINCGMKLKDRNACQTCCIEEPVLHVLLEYQAYIDMISFSMQGPACFSQSCFTLKTSNEMGKKYMTSVIKARNELLHDNVLINLHV